jgi:glycosyltransferase involved in cell wall biosynthesis
MWRRCRRLGIRHIHAHHANVASDVALLAARLGGPGWTWSFTLHGPTELFDAREHRLPQKAAHATFVACITHYARSQLMGMVGAEHWQKLRVVHCGVDLSAYALVDRAGRAEAREVLTVGRTVPAKGQALLIEAVAELARRDVDVRLTIVGDGPQLKELRELAARLGVSANIEFAGAVGQDEMPFYYARADLFAMASFAEGLPVVLMEAMASGIPVVASQITGIPELVEPGVNGVLVAPGRADDLADALEDLLTAPAARRAAMGMEGRHSVEAGFDIDGTARDLLDLFEEFAPARDATPQAAAAAVAGG